MKELITKTIQNEKNKAAKEKDDNDDIDKEGIVVGDHEAAFKRGISSTSFAIIFHFIILIFYSFSMINSKSRISYFQKKQYLTSTSLRLEQMHITWVKSIHLLQNIRK